MSTISLVPGVLLAQVRPVAGGGTRGRTAGRADGLTQPSQRWSRTTIPQAPAAPSANR